MLKIVTVVGARPQFIKAAAFSRVANDKIEEIIVHTGQHFDANMSEVFFDELGIPKPKYNLGIAGGSHSEMTGRMMQGVEEVLKKEMPDAIMVYGDTNSTMAAALAAIKMLIPVIHVEAGVRTGAMTNPEEVNRVVTDHVSTLLFTPTEHDLTNLKHEGIDNKAYSVGNIMYDSYLYAAQRTPDISISKLYDLDNNRITIPDRYYYLTCHRQENTFDDEPLYQIFTAMNSLDEPTVYPVHPRNRDRAIRLCTEFGFEKIILLQPVGYLESIYLLKNCIKVVTDSGGLQCEAFYAEKQCVTIFDHVIWAPTMVNNRNQLAKADAKDIILKLSATQVVDKNYQPFGDGHSADKILKIIMESDLTVR